ncbi:MAG: hypothetical protein RHS_6101 [Robinsoniella sp. RHS]|uniref:phage tail protein n=1 Tax=Robinsoniella sp. RHS TaxID=1504536 RepID=UPI00064AA05B|nr:MAG: hypothetical protein RHS_6101 [Robinsoniella sp. RHS]
MGAESVGQIALDMSVNKNGFDKQMKGITGLAKKAGVAIAAAFAVKKLVDFGKSCLDLGSDLNEVQNVVDVTFPQMSAQVNEFAKSAATSFGLSETMAKKFTGTFGAMAKAFGFNEEAAYEMSTALTGLTGDVASFYNISQDEAYTKLKSVFTGETESLKDLGIVMTQTALDAYAMSNGFGKATNDMTEAEKVALRYQFVQQQLATATGDFARTSDGWANQVRILSLQFDSLKATIGQGLINLFTPIIKAVNTLIGKLSILANAFKSFTELITGNKSSGQTAAPVADLADTAAAATGSLDGASGAADGLQESTKGVGSAAKKAAKDMKALMGFDQVNKLADPETDSDDSGSGGGAVGGTGGTVDYGNLAKGDTVIDKTASKFQGLIDKAKELAGLFKKGFQLGFGDSEKRIVSIKGHLAGIGQSLKEIFTDTKVAGSFNSMLDSIALNLGKVAGSAASMGLTIADNLVGGIDKYLSQNKEFIKQKLISIFDVAAEIAALSGKFSVAVADIFTVFAGDDAKQITADIISVFSNGFLTAVDLAGKLGRDILDTITSPIVENKDKMKTALENTLAPIRDVADSIAGLFNNTYKKIGETYDTYLAPSFTKIKDGISSILSTILDTYNTYVAPVLQSIADKFSKLVSEHVQPMVDSFLDCFGKIANAVATTWEETIAPFVNWIIENIVPVVAPLFEQLATGIVDTFGKIADIVKDVLDKLGAFADWCSNNQTLVTAIAAGLGSFFLAFKGVTFVSKLVSQIRILTPLLGGMGSAATSVIPMLGKMKSAGVGLFDTVKNLATGLGTKLVGAFQFLISPAGLVCVAIAAIIAIGVLVWKNWDTIKAKAIEIWGAIKEWFSKTIDAIKGFFTGLWRGITDTFASVGSWFKEKFTAAKNAVTGAFSTIGSWFGNRWKDISGAFSNTKSFFQSTFSAAWGNVKNAFSKSGSFFAGVWSGITGAFGNITNWFKDKFSAAWEAVKNVFSSGGQVFDGIKEGILEGLKAVINALINGINSVISVPFNGINWALDQLRNLSIGPLEPFTWLPSIDTPQIPALAQGGFVKPNTPQLAMIGDNRHQGEVVAPEGKMLEMAKQAALLAASGSITKEELESIVDRAVIRLIAALSALGFNLDGETIATAVQMAQTGMDRRFNAVTIK